MQKYKFTFQEDAISDEEIFQFQNFQQVLKKHELATVKAAYQAYLWKGLAVAGTIVVISASYYFYKEKGNSDPIAPPQVVAAPPETTPALDADPPAQQAEEMAKVEAAPDDTTTRPSLQKPSVEISLSSSANPELSTKEPPLTVKTITSLAEEQAPVSPVEAEYKEVVFTEAMPVEGYPALYRYFRTHLQFPEEATFDRMSGTVIVGFSINKNGRPTNIQVIEGVHKSIDQEAIRLIENMPVWTPAMVNNIPITTRLVIPITFQLTHLEKKPLRRP